MDILHAGRSANTLAIWGVSLLVHISFFSVVQYLPRRESAPVYQKVVVNVVEKPQSPVAPPEPAAAPEPRKAEPKPPAQEKTSAAPVPRDQSPPPKPVMGLSKDSFAEGGKSSISAPAGNTTMIPDDGQRISPEDIRKLDRDLSEDAKLIDGSFVIPEYTADAEENALEGSFVVEVYIDTQGKVGEAELRKKIGFGMDERVLKAVKSAKFRPRKNPLGQPLAGWTELRIRLTLE